MGLHNRSNEVFVKIIVEDNIVPSLNKLSKLSVNVCRGRAQDISIECSLELHKGPYFESHRSPFRNISGRSFDVTLLSLMFE